MSKPAVRLGWLVGLAVIAASGTARAACDPAVAASGREAIDAGCSCDDFNTYGRAAYRRCANQVVRAQVAAALLPTACRSEVLRHAKQSTCGRPGSVVCCRARADGRTRHRVVRNAARCTSTSSFSACVSGWHSVPSGCDTNGCIATTTTTSTTTTLRATTTTIGTPGCGNGIVEPGEDCDPPDYFIPVYCDHTCHSRICTPPATTCGNGTIDAGETCEPPGVGGCAPDCQATSCGVPAAGEIDVACAVPASCRFSSCGVSAAATASTYLVGWSEQSPSPAIDTVVRRFDVNGAPLDSGRTVLSTDVPCQSSHQRSALASDGHDFYAVWQSVGPSESDSFAYIEILGRRVGGGSGIGPLDHLLLDVPFGTRRASYDATMAAGVSPARFAVGWQLFVSDFGSLIFQDPIARVVDFNAVPVPQSLDVGFFHLREAAPATARSPARVAQLGPDTLWVYHALAWGPEPLLGDVVIAVFTDLAGVGPYVALSHRNELIGGRPGIAAGASSFLVAWGQGASAVATTVTEIRGVRATRADGRLDPDGGLLLATSSTAITDGPVVAFDGTRWLVVWAEESGSVCNEGPCSNHHIRAVAVESDGTVVDASPRVVASNVDAGEPAVASAGDGRVLVVFARTTGATRDVLATLVTP